MPTVAPAAGLAQSAELKSTRFRSNRIRQELARSFAGTATAKEFSLSGDKNLTKDASPASVGGAFSFDSAIL